MEPESVSEVSRQHSCALDPFNSALENLRDSLPEVVEALLVKAKKGDVSAAKLLYKELLALLKPPEEMVDIMEMLDENGEV